MIYKQCLLIKVNHDGMNIVTSWITSKYAQKDKWLKLKGACGNWDYGWRVDEVYNDIILNEDQVLKKRDAYRYQRDISDI